MHYFIVKKGTGLAIMMVPEEDLTAFFETMGHLVIVHAKSLVDALLSDQFTAWRAANPE